MYCFVRWLLQSTLTDMKEQFAQTKQIPADLSTSSTLFLIAKHDVAYTTNFW